MDNVNGSDLPVIQILERASSSEIYAGQLADLVEQKGLIKAPANLKSSVLARSRQLDIQLVVRSNQLSKKLALWYYGLKVSLAVACCVGFIISAPGMHENHTLPGHSSGFLSFRTEASQIIREFQEKVDYFSRDLWEMEVSPYDK